MKKGKVFGKKQVALAVMTVALAGAVWLNMKYSADGGGFAAGSSDTEPTASYLGEATFVNGNASEETAQTSAKAEAEDYFSKTRNERNNTRKEALEELKETISDAKVKDAVKTAAVEKQTELSTRMDTEVSIETLLKAKGFKDVLAVIGDNDINIVIKTEKLSESETVQIQDIATSQSGLTIDKVKIITAK